MSLYIYVDPDTQELKQTTQDQLGYAYGMISASLLDAGPDYSEDPAYEGVGIPRNRVLRRNLPIQYALENLRAIYEPYVLAITYTVELVKDENQNVNITIITNNKSVDFSQVM